MSGLSMLAAFAAVTLVVAAVGLVLPGRQLADRRRVTSRLRALSDPDLPAVPDGKGWGWHRVVSWLGERVAARTADPLAGLRTDLERAGYTHPSAGAYYLGARVVLVIVLAVLGGLAGLTYEGGGLSVVLGVVAGSCAGYLTPSLYLGSRVRGRQQAIRAGLPDALDVIVMCVESGSPVTAAVDYLADEIQTVHPVLGEQLAVVRREVQLGQTVGEAFRGFADRTGLAEVRDLAAVLIQSEQYGTGVGKALRTHSEAARTERQLWCEAMASKAAVKILFPTLLCIFPAMFIVLLGPAAFQMSKLFAR